jgi:hypothetical protein
MGMSSPSPVFFAGSWLAWDWGTVPAWVSTASVFLAAVSYWRSTLDKRREQASKVAAWVDVSNEDGETKFYLRVRNNSDAPIFGLIASVPGFSEIRNELPPNSSFDVEVPPSSTFLARIEKVGKALKEFRADRTAMPRYTVSGA